MRISTIEAPVVPMNDASAPPTPMIAVLVSGVARRSPRTTMPPAMTYRLNSSVRNGMYSFSTA